METFLRNYSFFRKIIFKHNSLPFKNKRHCYKQIDLYYIFYHREFVFSEEYFFC